MFLVFPVFTFRYLFDAPHPNLSFEQGEQGQGHSFIILSSLRLSAQRGFVWRTEDSQLRGKVQELLSCDWREASDTATLPSHQAAVSLLDAPHPSPKHLIFFLLEHSRRMMHALEG